MNEIRKKISWESWNEKEIEYNTHNDSKNLGLVTGMLNEFSDEDSEESQDIKFFGSSMSITTPFGVFPQDSMLKPSDRWECWIGHTNFPITRGMANKLNKEVDGIAAFTVMDKYSFCIGIGKSFNWTEVRKSIQEKLNI